MGKRNIIIVLAKEGDSSFNRYLIPVLGRSIINYPVLAAKYSKISRTVYIFTNSAPVTQHTMNIEDVEILPRETDHIPLEEELKRAIESEMQKKGFIPGIVVILFGNSPCIRPEMLTNAVDILEAKPEIDSVVSAMRRSEFEPSRMLTLNQKNLLERLDSSYPKKLDAFFLDKRFIAVRWEVLRKLETKTNFVESLLGKSICPMIQDEGIWDIDYAWQVPGTERWLRQNGFTDESTPYDSSGGPSIPVEGSSRATGNVTRVLISTIPFGDPDRSPLDLIECTPGISYTINPLGRKFKEEELAEYIADYDILIAGTEKISKKVLAAAKKLKLIARVGIGLDSVDLEEARILGIRVAYTPDAPSPAVAELTLAHMLNLLRKLPIVDRKMRSGVWQRIQGERLANQTVGVIGSGRVGRRVIKHLQGFNPRRILVNDLNPDRDFYHLYHAEYAEKEVICRECDIITLHVPLTNLTKDLLTSAQLALMKPNALLINTSRGGIINENDLYVALKEGTIAGAAIDVFTEEPYVGRLIELENCLISCHMGSMTKDCRSAMELLATEEAVRFVTNRPLLREVPEEEYVNAGLVGN